MTATKSISEVVNAIEAELARLGWLCTDDAPCAYCVTADADLPAGWVRVYDDSTTGYGEAEDVLADLQEVVAGAEYGTGCPDGDKPDNSRDWPEALFFTEQLEEGTANDEPNTLITIQTNGGTRYAAGPHGAFQDALSEAFQFGALYRSREDAINSIEATDDE